MSSFFDDDDDVPQQKKSKRPREETRRTSTTALSGGASSSDLHNATEVNPNRFLISAEDVSAAEQRRRMEAASSASSRPIAGGLGDSLAKSMEEAQLRRERERDEALIQKVQREREEELRDHPELIEKDLMIGVFVTDAYKMKLREHIRFQNGSTAAARSVAVDDEDEDVQFSGTMSKLTTASVYDVSHATTARVSVPEALVLLGKPEQDVSLDAAATVAGAMEANTSSQGEVAPVQSMRSAIDEAERAVLAAKAAAREARRHRQIDSIMLEAMRKRFELRQKQNLEHHLRYVAS